MFLKTFVFWELSEGLQRIENYLSTVVHSQQIPAGGNVALLHDKLTTSVVRYRAKHIFYNFLAFCLSIISLHKSVYHFENTV